MKRLLWLFIPLFFLFACQQKTNVKQVSISGEILTPGIDEIRVDHLIYRSLQENVSYKVQVDSTGHFQFSVPVEAISRFRLSAGNLSHTLYVLPTDQLHISIKNDSISYSGKGSERNYFALELERRGLTPSHFAALAENANKNDRLFLTRVNELRQARMALLENYAASLESSFKDFFDDQNNYYGRMAVLEYIHSRVFDDERTTPSFYVARKLSMFNSIAGFEDDSKVNSYSYLQCMNSLLRNKAEMGKEKGNYDERYTKLLKDSLSGKSREYATAFYLGQRMIVDDTVPDGLLKRFKAMEPDAGSVAYVQNAMDLYNYRRSLLGKPMSDDFARTMLEDSTGSKIAFGDLMKRFRGKMVYVDIWSLRSEISRHQLRQTLKLKEAFKQLPVVLLFLNQDKGGGQQWKQVVKESEGTENRFRLVDSQWGTAPMLRSLGFSGVPHYLLFDTAGRLVTYSAPGPYSKNRLLTKIRTLVELAR